MPTTLEEQLQKLIAPQSSIYQQDKKKASLLFNPKEAATKDRDTFFEIGISGLNELIAINDGFSIFRETLFSISSKDYERSIKSKENNAQLDKNIELFLFNLSPYLLLQPAHKACEWLVNRFNIHEYNQDAIMCLILPYHETNIFTRFIQILNLKTSSNKWHWLAPLQKQGTHLSKQTLFNHCGSNHATLGLISQNAITTVQIFGDRAYLLSTLYAFLASTMVGALHRTNKIAEAHVNAILPLVLVGLESPCKDYKAVAFIIVGYLVTKIQLKTKVLDEVISTMMTSEYEFTYESTLLLNLIFQSQSNFEEISEEVLNDFSANKIISLCKHVNVLQLKEIDITPFVVTFMKSVLRVIQSNIDFKRFSDLPEFLIAEVSLTPATAACVLRTVFQSFDPSTFPKENDGYGSDIEIIEENKVISNNMTLWYSNFLRQLEKMYPETFDDVLETLMKKHQKSRNSNLMNIINFMPKFSLKMGDNLLFENLNHANSNLRIQAVQFLSQQLTNLRDLHPEFVKGALRDRLNDDNPTVVSEVLNISKKIFKHIFTSEDILAIVTTILQRSLNSPKKWKKNVNYAFELLTEIDSCSLNSDIIYALMPHLFPDNKDQADIVFKLLNSPFGATFSLTKETNKKLKTYDHKILSEAIFSSLESCSWSLNEEKILSKYSFDGTNFIEIFFYLLLNSNILKRNCSPEDGLKLLNISFNTIKQFTNVEMGKSYELKSLMINDCIDICRNGKLPFPIIYYSFKQVMRKSMFVKWNPHYELHTPSFNFLLKTFSILITGCSKNNFSIGCGKLLYMLLHKVTESISGKMELISMFTCGHIINLDIKHNLNISPDVELRAAKLLNSLLKECEDFKWIEQSNLMIYLLLSLANPIAVVRTYSLNNIEIILDKKNPKSDVFYRKIVNHRDEIILDSDQISLILYTLHSPAKSFKDRNMKNLYDRFEIQHLINFIANNDTSIHLSSALISLLAHINSSKILVKLAHLVPEIYKSLNDSTKVHLHMYYSLFITNFYNRIDKSTVASLENSLLWEVLVSSLQEVKPIIKRLEGSPQSPCSLILNQIDSDTYELLPESKKPELLFVLFTVSSTCVDPMTVSAISRFFKKIYVSSIHFDNIFTDMLAVEDPSPKSQMRKSQVSQILLSKALLNTNEWKRGLSLLENLQNKKRIVVNESLIINLFKLLGKCLDFEDQSYVEYIKQLILSSILYHCKKFSSIETTKYIKNLFDIELVVKCIRGTHNPQTHHHAMMVLSYAASILPEQVLHHIMAIFTFIGSSLLRYDDAYSFQIVINIVETIVPILVNFDKGTETEATEDKVVPVLRIFADVALDVPEHRRLPLYKKLINTLGSSRFLWVFAALLLETHIKHWCDPKNVKSNNKSLTDQEAPLERLDFAKKFLAEFPIDVLIESYLKLYQYMKSLPLKKDDKIEYVNPAEIFSVFGHSALELRHYRYTIVTFLNSSISSPHFVQKVREMDDTTFLEIHLKSLVVEILIFIQNSSKVAEQNKQHINMEKYWKVLLHHSYELLDSVNNLLSVEMFLKVIKGLLSHNILTVRRKAMELLNNKLQFDSELFSNYDNELMLSLLSSLTEIIQTIEIKESCSDLEQEINQQTALLSTKLLTRMLASENPAPFIPVLEQITQYVCTLPLPGNMMASVILCLAELCSNLTAHAIAHLPRFMPPLICILKKQRKADTLELILLSTVTALCKIIESLPLFLSPYLKKILYEYSMLAAKWNSNEEDYKKIVVKLTSIRHKLSSTISPRVLIPTVNDCYHALVKKSNYTAVGPLMGVLADCFGHITPADFTALQQELTSFFLTALELRNDLCNKEEIQDNIHEAEGEIINALVCLVLKLSETSFRPLYFKLYEWATRINLDKKDRSITFYRLSCEIAQSLKGLFVLFANYFIKNAAELLDSCNKIKHETLYFDTEKKCCILVEYILKTLHNVFLYDSQSLLNKDRFEILMQPIVDQLENPLSGITALMERSKSLLTPCITQFAVAIGDDSLWKPLNYEILLKTRHNDPEIRLLGVECVVSVCVALGPAWLPLLAESVPFLAELLEDADARVEAAAKAAVRQLELVLGESLQNYF